MIDYPDGDVYYESFTINMRACMISQLTTSGDGTLTYNLYTPVEYISYTAFTLTHVAGTEQPPNTDCGYTLDYTAQWLTYYGTVISLPSFITWDHSNFRFEV